MGILHLPEAEQRAAVVAEARSWVGTPYRHCADVKRAGVDCGMLLVRVFVDLGLAEPFDPRPYPTDFHLHGEGERYLGFVMDRGREVEIPGPGDVVVWRIGRSFSHGGVVTEWPAPGVGAGRPGARRMVVHAYAPARVVEEADISLPGPLSLPRHPRRFFSYWRGLL